MPWPQTVEYNEAIQNPQECFREPDLARGQPVEGMMAGIPLSYAGSFATVYKVNSTSGVWAVKCFTRKVENLHLRYKEISDHLKRNKRRFAVDFQYLQEGIKVADTAYPVVKMQWVEGFTLNEFLRERVGNSALLEQMCQLWLRLGNEMREVQMAHGDLQHGNVMLVPGNNASSMLLRLVDYDGMWVPSLADRAPGEVGHPNYQHPQRLLQGGYSPDIDRFAHLAIYTSLRCLKVGGKALWTAHDNEENLLFRESDFKNPSQSKLFPKLLTLPDHGSVVLAGHLLLASQGPLNRVPSVSDLVSDAGVAPLTVEQIGRLRELVPAAPLGRPTVSPTVVPLTVQPLEVEDWFGPSPQENPKRANPKPSSPAIEVLPEVKPAFPTAIPLPPGSKAPAPMAILMSPAAAAAILEALPAEPPGSGSGRLQMPAIDRSAPLPPFPLKPNEKTRSGSLPPPPGRSVPTPTPKHRPGSAKNDLMRYWPVLLGLIVGLPLLLLAGGVLWIAFRPGETPVEKPRLLPLSPVTLRAGHEQEFVVSISRHSTDETLTVRVKVPDEVTCPEGDLLMGDTSGQVRLRLQATPRADYTGRMVVQLFHDDKKLDEQEVELTVSAFLPPLLVKKDLELQLPAGGSVLVLAEVIRNGNSDPWSLRAESLPTGVSQRPARGPLPAGQIGIELVAAPNAPEKVEIIKVSLFADGVFADFMTAKLSVEKSKAEVRIEVELPTTIGVPIGGKKSFEVQLSRNDYKGPIKLEVQGLPLGITGDPVDVADGAERADIELQAVADVALPFELQSFRVVAQVNGKEAGRSNGTFRLTRPSVEVKPIDPVSPPIRLTPQDVSFETGDGLTLPGTLYPGAKGKEGPTVLMVPEPSKRFSRKEDSWVRLALALQKLGCSVLTFDFRGFGEKDLTSVPASFWTVKVNEELLAILKRSSIPKGSVPATLEGEKFPTKYLPWLIQDIVAARFFLDTKHDKGILNSKNLIVIGAGQGATLASFWYAAECCRQKLSAAGAFAKPQPPFENRDIIATVWLDNRPTLVKLNLTSPLAIVKKLILTEKVHPRMLFVYDHRVQGAAALNLSMRKNILGQPADSDKPIDGAGLSGQTLLSDLTVKKTVLTFVSDVLKKHEMRAWSTRGFWASTYIWNLGGVNHWAKLGNVDNNPQILPLDALGFKDLPAR